jgi:hypothetical protein
MSFWVCFLAAALAAAAAECTRADERATVEVIVLSTLHQMHERSATYSYQALSDIIEGLDPDVLAVELTAADLESRRDQPVKREYQNAVFPLLDRHHYPVVPLEPDQPRFDEIVDRFRAAQKDLREQKPSVAESFDLYTDSLFALLEEKGLSPGLINSKSTDALFEMKHRFQHEVFGPLDERAWNEWNQHFLQQILEAAGENPGKRMVVLVGAEHSYWLKKHLAGPAVVVANTEHLLEGLLPGDGCQASGEYAFVCGPKNAEDLVQVPESEWILASGMAAGGAIYLVNSEQKTWTELYPAAVPRARQDMERYGGCPGAPDPEQLVTHGLNLRPGAAGHSTLYVVGHGGREAIEVFDVNANGEMPVLTWTGCVMTPDGMEANSVASLEDGSLLVTIPLYTGIPISDALAGKSTGAVFGWSPGDAGFTKVRGTEMPYANGIEVSADGSEFYVASSGLFTVTAFSNSNPARRLRATEPFGFVPDNLHMNRDGNLVTAGLNYDDPVCGKVERSEDFDLEAFATCPRAFTVWEIDPGSMRGKPIAHGPANKNFSNITMALQVRDELWIGTFAGDRIAYRSLIPGN